MCFANEPDRLAKLRAKKTAITVWKIASLNPKTGLCYSQYNGEHDRVWWKKGTIVTPTRIRSPIKGRCEAGAGLYFYTDCQRVIGSDNVIKARVQPEDIIGVGYNGSQVCVVAAKVIDAPNPDQTEMRIKYLKEKIQEAENAFATRKETVAMWNAEEPGRTEALQQMLDEVKELRR